MKRLIALMLIALLASACDATTGAPLSTVTREDVPKASPTSNATTTPPPPPRLCDNSVDATPYPITLTPGAPRPGQTVALVGSGLEPGTYEIWAGYPQSDVGTVQAAVKVGDDGLVATTFKFDSPRPGECIVVLVWDQSAFWPRYRAKPFRAP